MSLAGNTKQHLLHKRTSLSMAQEVNNMQLSPYQKIFYYEWKLAPSSSKYNIVFDQTLSSNLDIKRLKSALHRFISDYFIMNSHIMQIDDELSWVLNDEIIELEYFDAPYLPEQVFNYVSAPFDIETSALYRFALFTEADGSYRFISVLHHLLIDGNSFDTLINVISDYYNSPQYKANHSLLKQKNILKNATDLFNSGLRQFGSQYQCFWDEKLSDIKSVDLRWAKSENDADKIKEHRFSLAHDVIAKLASLTKDLDISIYLYSQCIFAILLHKYTSETKIAFSSPIVIKNNIPLISGACVNTTINIYEFNTATTIIDLFKQNKNLIKSIKSVGESAHYYPINNIINNENKDLLNIMFAQTNLKNTAFNFIGTETHKINSEFNIDLPTEIIFELEKQENTLHFRVRHNLYKIDETIIANFVRQYEYLFLNILNDLCSGINSKTVNQYSILSKMEYDQIVYKWNQSSASYNINKTIQELFEEQVLETPNNTAIVYEGTALTYAELNEQSNQLAHYLRNIFNIKGDDLIALYLDRSEYMLIVILAVLKAGGAYVPIDVTHPANRVRCILNDIAVNVLITNKHNYDSISNIYLNHESINDCEQYSCNKSMSIIAIDTFDIQSQLKQQTTDNPDLNIGGNNLAYVMYTSGTIGNPKGVMLEQHSVATRVMSMIEMSGINAQSKYLFKTNYVFDVSFSDIFMTLLSGASLYITKSVFDIEEICNLIIKNNINICHFVPSQLEVINEYLSDRNIFSNLQIINVSGEKFDKPLIYEKTNIKYVNYYGPTETGEVSCDVYDVKNYPATHPKLSTIGYPLDQSTLFILDNHLNPLPIGAIGELYVGGAGLARGYLNMPELTKELFISNPFQDFERKHTNYNCKLYKTGDLVRYLPDGNIEYIGRSDNQVKIRGFRVELGEIETKLLNYPGIKQAVVLDQEQKINISMNEKCLVAYYVSNMELDENLIQEYLAQELPEYMLPSFFIYLNQLPLSVNGKLNKRALPPADITTRANTYVAPRNELEQKICEFYAEVLKLSLDKISINDNFFKLGGNSISAIHLTFKLQRHFDVTVNDIFEYKTPEKIARLTAINRINSFDKLKQIKLMYSKLIFDKETNIAIEHRHAQYQQKVKSFRFNNKIKSTSIVLLTGATGYLGCHLLYELLSTTNHLIYIPVRDNFGENPSTKLCDKFRYYFNIDLNIYIDRINVFSSDLSKENLGLDKLQYENLINSIDSVIHSAALVKHYGSNAKFYSENVQTTINLLELAKLTSNKDFHYISTIGVFTTSRLSSSSYNIFTEECIDDNQANMDNLYTKTKYQGEQFTLKYREYGVRTSIYRVGNLAINSVTHKTQENIEDNAFFQRVRTILKLGIIPQELSELEISPVDSSARAITLLFNQAELDNQIYHVVNPHKCNLYKLFNNKITNIELVPFPTFINTIKRLLLNSLYSPQIELFLLHQWGLYFNANSLAQTIIFQDKTNYILEQLEFKWSKITPEMLSDLTQKCQNMNIVNNLFSETSDA